MGRSSRSPQDGVFGSEMHVRCVGGRTAGTADGSVSTAIITPWALLCPVSPKHLHLGADFRPPASTPVESGARCPLISSPNATVRRAVRARRVPSAHVQVAARLPLAI